MNAQRIKSRLPKKFSRKVGAKALWTLEKGISKFSKVGDHPFFEADIFPWTRQLEARWTDIRAELETVLENVERIPSFQQISKDQVSITTDDKWKTYFLYGMGYKAEKNCARCPETTRLIEGIPGMKTAFFSILSPHKHIPEHRGLYKGFLRYHLGLIVPEPKEQCRIRVWDETRHWEEGASMVFDDTYPHEVWNDTEGVRVVLFMDVVRPLSFPVSAINEGIIRLVQRSSYVQDAKRNQEEWESRLRPNEKVEG